jgi:hypothetical protein
MGAPTKAELLAKAAELGYAVDDSLTRKDLAELVARGPAVPEEDAGELVVVTADNPDAEGIVAGLEKSEKKLRKQFEKLAKDTPTEEGIADPEGTPVFPAGDHADEPGSHDPDLAAAPFGVNEQRRAMRYPTAVRIGRPRI